MTAPTRVSGTKQTLAIRLGSGDLCEMKCASYFGFVPDDTTMEDLVRPGAINFDRPTVGDVTRLQTLDGSRVFEVYTRRVFAGGCNVVALAMHEFEPLPELGDQGVFHEGFSARLDPQLGWTIYELTAPMPGANQREKSNLNSRAACALYVDDIVRMRARGGVPLHKARVSVVQA